MFGYNAFIADTAKPVNIIRNSRQAVFTHLFVNLNAVETQQNPSCGLYIIVPDVVERYAFGIAVPHIAVCLDINLAFVAVHSKIEEVVAFIYANMFLPFGLNLKPFQFFP